MGFSPLKLKKVITLAHAISVFFKPILILCSVFLSLSVFLEETFAYPLQNEHVQAVDLNKNLCIYIFFLGAGNSHSSSKQNIMLILNFKLWLNKPYLKPL